MLKYLVLVGVFLGLLQGCVQPNFRMTDTLESNTEIKANQGVVVARVVNATDWYLPFNQLTIAPKQLNNSSKDAVLMERMSAVEYLPWTHGNHMQGAGITSELYKRKIKSTSFTAAVSAGEYALNDVRSYHLVGDYIYTRSLGADAAFGTFTVAAGKVTDLGTLIVYPKVDGEQYTTVLLRSPDSSVGLEVLRGEYPEYHGPLLTADVLTWHDDGRNDSRRDFFVGSVRNPTFYNESLVSASGDIYLVGLLGAIIHRDTSGQWLLDAVDSDLDLDLIASSPSGDIAVAGEKGRLFYKKKKGEWKSYSIRRDNAVKHILLANNGDLDVILQSKKYSVTVMRANLNDLDETGALKWQEQARYFPRYGWSNSEGTTVSVGAIHYSKDDKKRHKIKNLNVGESAGHHYISINDQLFEYNPANWDLKTVSSDRSVKSFVFDQDKILGWNSSGVFSSSKKLELYSFDEVQDDWIKMSRQVINCHGTEGSSAEECLINGVSYPDKSEFRFYGMPDFKTEDLAYAYVVSGNGVNRDLFYIKTEDGGKVWKRIHGASAPDEFCRKLLPSPDEKLISTCNGNTLDIYESADEGLSWQHVRQHENF